MAQFMDNRVSPIKIKIWMAEEGGNHMTRLISSLSPHHTL